MGNEDSDDGSSLINIQNACCKQNPKIMAAHRTKIAQNRTYLEQQKHQLKH